MKKWDNSYWLWFVAILVRLFLLIIKIQFIFVLWIIYKGTLSWFLLFFSKNLLRSWKSGPCFFISRLNLRFSYSVHSLDFSLDLLLWLLLIDEVSLWVDFLICFVFFLKISKINTSKEIQSIRFPKVDDFEEDNADYYYF